MGFSIHQAKAALLLMLVAAMIGISSCGGSAPLNAYSYVIQTSSPTTGGIAQLRVANDGELTQIGPANLGSINLAEEIFVHPSGSYLLLDAGDGNIYEFTIGSDGALAANPAATIKAPALGDGISSLGFTRNGQFVVTAGVNFSGSNPVTTSYTVSSYALDASGIPALVTTLTVNHDPNSFALDPSGRYLFVATYDNLILDYALSSSGVLSLAGSTPFTTTSGCSISISPNEFLYCGSNGEPLETAIYSINPSSGALAQTGSLPISGVFAFHPSGKYAYSSLGPVSQYTVDPRTGVLTPNGPEISDVNDLVLDPTGKFALVLSAFDTVSSYTIGSDGRLKPSASLALDQNVLAQRMAIARH
jgi:6-phosphogluconolactonase (cycloisomerase 2 family)